MQMTNELTQMTAMSRGVNHRRQFAETINGLRKKFQPVVTRMKCKKLVAVSHRENAQAKTGRDADDADDGALEKKNSGICKLVAPSALSIPISRVFWIDKGDLCAQDAKRRDEHDEKQQVKHDVLFDDERAENRRICPPSRSST